MDVTISMVNNIETMKELGFIEMNGEFADIKGNEYIPNGLVRMYHPTLWTDEHKSMIVDIVFPAHNPNNYGYFVYCEDIHFTISENDKENNYINCKLISGVQPEFAPNIVFADGEELDSNGNVWEC